ncbi:hypothetical protein SAMN05421846_10356 [Chryseobacterium taeanense]|uniref:Uncharacterized protein n=1 Tax=Chryseobacterium taeanense TaxID=311334 RepID=A0A1G8GPK1_9FLAO|nr:hypothetical protein [Chryseobacterium taeanense]SDH96312.1 hypothetical protein SAMN05421846_10356 [Chryseobacterium taeanense]
MLKRIFTKKNFLRSLTSAIAFLVSFYLIKLLFYYLGWDDEKSMSLYGFIFYFVFVFLALFILDGRDYTWKDVIKFKNLNKNK